MRDILSPHERYCKGHLLLCESTLPRGIAGCGKTASPIHEGLPYMELNPNKVRDALARMGKTQADLSRLTGWSEAKVSRYVTGKNLGEVTLTNLTELAAALRVSPAELVDLEDVAQTDAEKRLLRNFRTAPARDKDLAQAQVEPRSPAG